MGASAITIKGWLLLRSRLLLRGWLLLRSWLLLRKFVATRVTANLHLHTRRQFVTIVRGNNLLPRMVIYILLYEVTNCYLVYIYYYYFYEATNCYLVRIYIDYFYEETNCYLVWRCKFACLSGRDSLLFHLLLGRAIYIYIFKAWAWPTRSSCVMPINGHGPFGAIRYASLR